MPPPFPTRRSSVVGWPGFVEPALATLKATAPSGARWIHEIKFDGYRLQAHVRGGGAKLFTRSGLDWTAKFGHAITAALAALPVKERSEEHTSELQSLMRISYAGFCLKKKKK